MLEDIHTKLEDLSKKTFVKKYIGDSYNISKCTSSAKEALESLNKFIVFKNEVNRKKVIQTLKNLKMYLRSVSNILESFVTGLLQRFQGWFEQTFDMEDYSEKPFSWVNQ